MGRRRFLALVTRRVTEMLPISNGKLESRPGAAASWESYGLAGSGWATKSRMSMSEAKRRKAASWPFQV